MKNNGHNKLLLNNTVLRYIISALILISIIIIYMNSVPPQDGEDTFNNPIISSSPALISETFECSPISGNNSEAESNAAEYTALTYTFRNEELLQQHYEKHGNEFTYSTIEEYVLGANRVIASKDALTKTEAEDGDLIFYLEETNEIVFLSGDGYIRTYFKPKDGIRYYERQ